MAISMNIFPCAYLPLCVLFSGMSLHVFCPLSGWIVCFLLLSFKESLYIIVGLIQNFLPRFYVKFQTYRKAEGIVPA